MADNDSGDGEVSSAQAVLLGALAPGVNVSSNQFPFSFSVSPFSPANQFFQLNSPFFNLLKSGSYMDYTQVGVFDAGTVSCPDACPCILFQ